MESHIRAVESARTRENDLPKVVSIVLNWNGWLDTIECLESLLRSDYQRHQIVVCDNGSHDQSIERLREWADGLLSVTTNTEQEGRTWSYRPVPKPLRYVIYDSIESAHSVTTMDACPIIIIQNGENLGYAGGNNVGVRYALERLRAEYVWILNNDTVVDRHAISRLTESAMREPDVGIVGSRLLQYRVPDRIQALGGGRFFPALANDTQIGRGKRNLAFADAAFDLEHVVGASMFVRAEAIRDVGPLDESYFLYREETDWCIQMRNKNWRLIYCPLGIVWHKEGHSVGYKSVLHDYYAVRNMLYLIKKFYPDALPSAFFCSFWRVFTPKLARLQFRRLYFVGKAYADFVRGIRGKSAVKPELLLPHRR